MAKVRDLLSELKGDPPVGMRGSNESQWWERMTPDEYKSLEHAAIDWLMGGRMRKWFPSKSALHLYLSGKHPVQACEPPVVFVKISVFYRFMNMLELTHGKTP